MRIFTPLLFLFPVLVYGQSLGNSEEINQKIKARFPLENGLILYNITGDASGQAELHFDRNGWRSVEKKNLVIERYGIKSTETILELKDGDYHYQINLNAGKGKKTIDKIWSGLLGYRPQEEAIADIMTGKGGVISGQDTLLDKPCIVWKFGTGTIREIWLWNGVPLKVKKELPGLTYEMIATNISPITSISTELLQLPQSVIWTD